MSQIEVIDRARRVWEYRASNLAWRWKGHYDSHEPASAYQEDVDALFAAYREWQIERAKPESFIPDPDDADIALVRFETRWANMMNGYTHATWKHGTTAFYGVGVDDEAAREDLRRNVARMRDHR